MRTVTALGGMVAAAVIGAGVVVYAQPGSGWGGGYGPGWMMNGGYGPGWMHGWMMRGYGTGMMGYGTVQRGQNLSAEDVKGYLEQTIQNPRLKVGEVKQTDDGTITAEIVTKDKDVLVNRLLVNRHTGWWRPQD